MNAFAAGCVGGAIGSPRRLVPDPAWAATCQDMFDQIPDRTSSTRATGIKINVEASWLLISHGAPISQVARSVGGGARYHQKRIQ